MLRTIARFFFWHHLKATMWVSGIVAIIAALNYAGIVFAVLKGLFGVTSDAYRPFDMTLITVGILAFGAYIFCLLINHRRKAEK
jgi:hypothetical protein